jgi:hypothetical protein
MQQLEVALRIGLPPRLWWFWGRYVWHRSKIESGRKMNQLYPDTFWVPEDEVKDDLRPGDRVKLLWMVKRMEASGERSGSRSRSERVIAL